MVVMPSNGGISPWPCASMNDYLLDFRTCLDATERIEKWSRFLLRALPVSTYGGDLNKLHALFIKAAQRFPK